MTQSDEPPETPREGEASLPANPFNIDHAKERRLKKLFAILIAAAFVLGAILLFMAFMLDSWIDVEPGR